MLASSITPCGALRTLLGHLKLFRPALNLLNPLCSESSCILSGLGYNPRTGHYDASRNLRIRNIELAPNFKAHLSHKSKPGANDSLTTGPSAGPPRLVEHERERLAARVHLQASRQKGSQARVSFIPVPLRSALFRKTDAASAAAADSRAPKSPSSCRRCGTESTRAT